MTEKKAAYRAILFVVMVSIMAACSSNNCPLENFVGCNYRFYNSEGTPISYTSPFTISTLLPGYKTVYVYRRLGSPTITLDQPNPSLVEEGYIESVTETRRDTVLVNSTTSRSSVSVPMGYYHEKDTLIFSYTTISSKDTIIVSHKSYPHIDLPECGSYRFHSLMDITSTEAGIDHVEISNTKVNYDGNENIKIFFNGVAQ